MSRTSSPQPGVPDNDWARRRKEFLRYQAALLELSARDEKDLGSFLRGVLHSDATLLGVERVSYWVFEKEPPAIRCVVLYRLSDNSYDGEWRYSQAECPRYFRALHEELVILADDALHDERTREFAASYLPAEGITSMMDVPVWVQGRLHGVVCHEHVGPARNWLAEEQAFALAIGQLVSTGLEAHERRRAERLLRESEERFDLLARSASDYSLILLDPEGRIRAGTERIRGFREEEVLGKHLSAFYPPEALEQAGPDQALRRALEQGRDVQEGWLVRKDGSRFWAQVAINPLFTETGALRGFATVVRDLTERRMAHEKERLLSRVQTAEEQQRLLSKVSATLIASLDEERLFSGALRMMTPLLMDGGMLHLVEPADGAQRVRSVAVAAGSAHLEAVLGHLADALVNPLQRGPALTAALEEGTPSCLTEVGAAGITVLSRWDAAEELLGELAVGSLLILPLTARRRVVGALTLLRRRGRPPFGKRDIRLAEELARRAAYSVDNARLYRMAQQAVGLRDDFLSVAAHELRTPLAALRLHLDGLDRMLHRRHVEGITPVIRYKLDSAGRQVRRLARLVDDLMEVSSISSGRLAVRREQVDLVDLVRDLVEDLQGEAERARSRLEFRASAPTVGEWDPLRLEQVVTHLLSNALKFGSGRPVEVEVRREGEQALVMVRDHGIGVSARDHARIFERFGRAVSVHHFGGLGLGLFVSRSIAETHGGTLELESRPGEGATFTLRLPLHPVEAQRGGTLPMEEGPRVLH